MRCHSSSGSSRSTRLVMAGASQDQPGLLKPFRNVLLGRPMAAPLERCAELLGVDLATIRAAAAKVEPYLRADGIRIWSLMQQERQLRPEATASAGETTSTADRP
jgi:hypothetical protein